MSYSGLGIFYQIPTTGSSKLFPDGTITMDVPMQQIVADAVAIAWPDVMNRTAASMPFLIANAMPSASQQIPSIVEQAWPLIQAKADAYVPSAWEMLKPEIKKQIDASVSAENQKAAMWGTLFAAALVGAGYVAYKRVVKPYLESRNASSAT